MVGRLRRVLIGMSVMSNWMIKCESCCAYRQASHFSGGFRRDWLVCNRVTDLMELPEAHHIEACFHPAGTILVIKERDE